MTLLRRLAVRTLAWALTVLGTELEEKPVAVADDLAKIVSFRGKPVPAGSLVSFGQLFVKLGAGLAADKPKDELLQELEPIGESIVEDLAPLIFEGIPGIGAGVALVAWLIKHSGPATPEQIEAREREGNEGS